MFFVGIDEATSSGVIATNFPDQPRWHRVGLAVTSRTSRCKTPKLYGGNDAANGFCLRALAAAAVAVGWVAGGALFVNGAADVSLESGELCQ